MIQVFAAEIRVGLVRDEPVVCSCRLDQDSPGETKDVPQLLEGADLGEKSLVGIIFDGLQVLPAP